MKTIIELGSDGKRTVFHRTATGAWTHPEGERYRYWTDKGPQAGRGKDRMGWVEMRCDCAQILDKPDDEEMDAEDGSRASASQERASGPVLDDSEEAA